MQRWRPAVPDETIAQKRGEPFGAGHRQHGGEDEHPKRDERKTGITLGCAAARGPKVKQVLTRA